MLLDEVLHLLGEGEGAQPQRVEMNAFFFQRLERLIGGRGGRTEEQQCVFGRLCRRLDFGLGD
ncbi:MAG: Uncharacterised protein [Halieaceae bacterium]|nr:MAG: Uncharacterised protein [Halieaceae bacterium]